MNCRNVQNEIEAAGSARFLSAAVLTHIRECKHCEVTAEEQDRLHAMLANLGTVEAPDDFDFRLRARLAAANGQKSRFGFAIPSFALRALAAVAVFVLLAGGFWIVALKSPTTNVADEQPPAKSENKPTTGSVEHPETVAVVPPSATTSASGGVKISRPRRESSNELASSRSNRSATRDEASTAAEILKKYNQLAGPGSGFPIDASYQNLKVSVDDGTGTSRTISLPAVSFGSQRTLSQNVSPIMASNRGTW
jgi:hypothetical protein